MWAGTIARWIAAAPVASAAIAIREPDGRRRVAGAAVRGST